MSVRYSGDAEVRVGYDPKRRVYRGTVVDSNGLRWRGEVGAHASRDPRTPESYDRAARALLTRAEGSAARSGKRFTSEKKNGRYVIRRGYQAPCPLE